MMSDLLEGGEKEPNNNTVKMDMAAQLEAMQKMMQQQAEQMRQQQEALV